MDQRPRSAGSNDRAVGRLLRRSGGLGGLGLDGLRVAYDGAVAAGLLGA